MKIHVRDKNTNVKFSPENEYTYYRTLCGQWLTQSLIASPQPEERGEVGTVVYMSPSCDTCILMRFGDAATY